jgi:hypothetical protein
MSGFQVSGPDRRGENLPPTRRLSMRLKALRAFNRRQVRRVRQVILRLGRGRCPLVPVVRVKI